jgi:hypothetical protein
VCIMCVITLHQSIYGVRSTLSPNLVHYNVKSEVRKPLDSVSQLCTVCALRITKDPVQANSLTHCYNGYSEVYVFLKLKKKYLLQNNRGTSLIGDTFLWYGR